MYHKLTIYPQNFSQCEETYKVFKQYNITPQLHQARGPSQRLYTNCSQNTTGNKQAITTQALALNTNQQRICRFQKTVKHLDQYLKILNYLVHKSTHAVLSIAH